MVPKLEQSRDHCSCSYVLLIGLCTRARGAMVSMSSSGGDGCGFESRRALVLIFFSFDAFFACMTSVNLTFAN